MNKRIILIASVIIISAIAVLHSADAQTKRYELLEPLPCLPGMACTEGYMIEGVTLGDEGNRENIPLKDYLIYVINLIIALATAAAVFMIVWGGFLYVTSESWSGKGDAKSKITNAILGLLLVFSSYLILRTINPKLVEIPATIVPKLEINQSMYSTNQSFMRTLNKSLSDLNLAIKESELAAENARNDRNAQYSQRIKYEEELSSLHASGANMDTDPDVIALKEKIAKIESDSKLANIKYETSLARMNMDSHIQFAITNIQDNELDIVKSITEAIKKTNDYVGQRVLRVNGDSDTISAITAEGSYTRTILNITGAEFMIIRGSTMKSISGFFGYNPDIKTIDKYIAEAEWEMAGIINEQQKATAQARLNNVKQQREKL